LSGEEIKGCLSPASSSVLMKILYMARFARPDVLFATCRLARVVSRWTRRDDLRLLRLVSYIASTPDLVMEGKFVHDDAGKLHLGVFADSDFAGDPTSSRSTSGSWVGLIGPGGSKLPLAWHSRRQTCTSHSTPEAECVAVNCALRTLGLPLMSLMSFFDKRIGASLYEDNTTCATIVDRGHSAALIHMDRTHRVSLSWVAEVLQSQSITIIPTPSENMIADAFTKSFSPNKWQHILDLLVMKVAPAAAAPNV
jgi:hypothetical protein